MTLRSDGSTARLQSGDTLQAGTPSAANSPLNVPCSSTIPSAPNNGDFWCTAAGVFVQINGATVGPLGTGGGSSGGLFNQTMSGTPSLSSTGFTTWVNQGATATVGNIATGVLLSDLTTVGNANAWRMYCKAFPSVPFTIIALVSPMIQSTVPGTAGSPQTGIALYNSSTSKIEIAEDQYNGSSSPDQLFVTQWTNTTTFSSSNFGGVRFSSSYFWVKIVVTSTTLTYYYGSDGANWGSPVYTDTISSGFFAGSGPNNICLAVNPSGDGASASYLMYSD